MRNTFCKASKSKLTNSKVSMFVFIMDKTTNRNQKKGCVKIPSPLLFVNRKTVHSKSSTVNSEANFSIYGCKKILPIVKCLAQCCQPRDNNQFAAGIIKNHNPPTHKNTAVHVH